MDERPIPGDVPAYPVWTVVTGPSRRRTFWVADDLWFAALAKAAERGGSLAEVLREALRRYVRRNPLPQPEYGTVPGDGWAAPETYADHPLRLAEDDS